jgi:hypothetical protein
MRFRFSLRWLFGALTLSAVAVAAHWNANRWWAAGFVVATLGSLVFATITALLPTRRKAFWTGFAVTGCAYFLLAFSLQWILVADDLPTGWLLYAVVNHALAADDEPFRHPIHYSWREVLRGDLGFYSTSEYLHWFAVYKIGHCLWTVVLACLAGALTERLAGGPSTARRSAPSKLE